METDIRTEYIIFKDMANYHSDSIGTYWATAEKRPDQLKTMAKIVTLQKSVANKMKRLHASLVKDIKLPTIQEEEPCKRKLEFPDPVEGQPEEKLEKIESTADTQAL